MYSRLLSIEAEDIWGMAASAICVLIPLDDLFARNEAAVLGLFLNSGFSCEAQLMQCTDAACAKQQAGAFIHAMREHSLCRVQLVQSG
eukprot:186704-Pelagomonas_calceolata.AAC.1